MAQLKYPLPIRIYFPHLSNPGNPIVSLQLHQEPFKGYQPSLERHGGKTMWIVRIKRVRFFISPLPLQFPLVF